MLYQFLMTQITADISESKSFNMMDILKCACISNWIFKKKLLFLKMDIKFTIFIPLNIPNILIISKKKVQKKCLIWFVCASKYIHHVELFESTVWTSKIFKISVITLVSPKVCVTWSLLIYIYREREFVYCAFSSTSAKILSVQILIFDTQSFNLSSSIKILYHNLVEY
jgi:NADH:ubiquinone oxidoreductase subunit K